MNAARLLGLMLADSWQCLNYERSRAPTPRIALERWYAGQAMRLKRTRELDVKAQVQLLAVERLCAQRGLHFRAREATQTAPWHLPCELIKNPRSAWPEHAAIDAQLLATEHRQRSSGQSGIGALDLLRWHLQRTAQSAARAWGDATRLRQQGSARVAVQLHLFFPDLWPEIRQQLQLIPEPFDLIVTVPDFAAHPMLQELQRDYPHAHVLPCPNRGRDVLPFVRVLSAGLLRPYELVCKIHSKRSTFLEGGGDTWRQSLYGALLGNADNVAAILTHLRAEPAIGLLGPAEHLHRFQQASGWQKNMDNLRRWARSLGLPHDDAALGESSFFAGTMFWLRPAALDRLAQVGLTNNDFPAEHAQIEGTLAHALERLLGPLCEHAHFAVQPWPTESHEQAQR